MQLKIEDRLTLMGLLPQEGNLVTLRVLRDFQRELGFTDEEIQKHRIATLPNGLIQWSDKKESLDYTKEVKINATIEDIVAKQLRDLDTQKRLRMSHLRLWELFIDKKPLADIQAPAALPPKADLPAPATLPKVDGRGTLERG